MSDFRSRVFAHLLAKSEGALQAKGVSHFVRVFGGNCPVAAIARDGSLGVNFLGGGGLKPWRNKAEKFAEKFAEKCVGNFLKIHPTKINISPQIHSAEPRDQNFAYPIIATGKGGHYGKFFGVSRKWTFLKTPQFPKDPFIRSRQSLAQYYLLVQWRISVWPRRNRAGTGIGTVGTVFPGTECGTRTARTVFFRNRNRNRPSLYNCTETLKENKLPWRNRTGTENRNRSNRSTPKP